MGVTAGDLPLLTALLPADMKKFRCSTAAADLTVDNIGVWADEVLAGTVKAHLKSAEAPVPNDGPVTIVVGSEWETIVKDPTKDVFVKYYAPWCGHCKALAPHWEDLGKHFEGMPNVVIAKFDSTENEADGVEVQSYPTLIFYPKDNKSGDIKYDGERELEPLKKWVEENAQSLKEKSPEHDEL